MGDNVGDTVGAAVGEAVGCGVGTARVNVNAKLPVMVAEVLRVTEVPDTLKTVALVGIPLPVHEAPTEIVAATPKGTITTADDLV